MIELVKKAEEERKKWNKEKELAQKKRDRERT